MHAIDFHTGAARGDDADLLSLVGHHAETVGRTLAQRGESTLADYLTAHLPASGAPYQSRDDLCETVESYAGPLLGETVAGRLAAQIDEQPLVLTANHHGMDSFAQSVQGTLLLALRRLLSAGEGSATTVLACGAVPLNNLTYPRGVLLYGLRGPGNRALPLKVPVFSDRLKRTVVSAAPPIDAAMTDRFSKRVDRLAADATIGPDLHRALVRFVEHDLRDEAVTACPGYAEQSVKLNDRIWRGMFNGAPPVDVGFLEIERITATLLTRDLVDETSLAHQVFFNPDVRSQVVAGLDGARACWDLRGLAQREQAARNGDPVGAGTGTVFFWAMSSNGRIFPLAWRPGPGANGVLVGADDHGEIVEIAFESEALAQALVERRLLPSTFTSYLTVGLARAVTCAGGYYQSVYLPAMQAAVVAALARAPLTFARRDRVAAVVTDGYLSGMQTLLVNAGDGVSVPAGPFEIAAAGGLGDADWERIARIRVSDAHAASLSETVADVIPVDDRPDDWWAAACAIAGGVGGDVRTLALPA